MIEINNFSKKYKNNDIFISSTAIFANDTVSFLMGKNGCGKTTLIKCICGLESYKGDIFFDKKKIDFETRKKMLTIWDDCVFYFNLSGIDNLRIFDSIHSKSKILEVALEYLSEEKLNENVIKYSYGQKKLLSLILVDLLCPQILIMDEITNGLDYSTLKRLKIKIAEWKKNSVVILTGHNLDYYSSITDSLFIVKNKSIIKKEFENSNFGDIYDKEFS